MAKKIETCDFSANIALALAKMFTDKFGFAKKDTETPTADLIANATADDMRLAMETADIIPIMEYFKGLSDDEGYVSHCKEIIAIGNDKLPCWALGFVASMPNSYVRSLEHNKAVAIRALSKHIGSEGDTVTLKCIITKKVGNRFGGNAYTLKVDNNICHLSTAREIGDVGDTVERKFIVKKHGEYSFDGTKFTQLSLPRGRQ